MTFENNIKKLNIELPNAPDPVGSYVATKIVGKLLYISGQISINDKGELIKGKLGKELNTEDGYKAAERCALNIISQAKNACNNDLSKIKELGCLLSNIHASGIVHGDPTSSNFIVSSKLYAVDFGLGSVDDSNEARATDLRVLLESLEGHHSELNCRETLLGSYSDWEKSNSVLDRLKIIERRGRYNLMRG